MKKCLFAAAFLSGLLASNLALGDSHGVLGLFEMSEKEDFAPAVAEFNGRSGHCSIQRSGIIAGEQGDIDLDQPSHFILLDCGEATVSGPEAQNMLSGFSSLSDQSVILAGPASHFPEDNSAASVTKRSYILKISHFSNSDPSRRVRELEELRQGTLALKDRYRRETFLKVTDAVGMETPDEAVLIFY